MNAVKRIHGRHRAAASFLAAVFAALCAFSPAALGQGKTTVRVAAESIVDGERVSLGQISSVSGDAALTEKISKISLGYSPNIGATREIRREHIEMAIAAAGIARSEVILTAPASVIVRRSGQELKNSTVRKAVETELLSKFRTNDIDTRLVRLDVPSNFHIPNGIVDLHVNSSSVRNFFSPFSLPVEVRVDGKLVRSFAVTAEIEAFANVLVTAREMPAGASVTESDVRLETFRLSRPASAYIRDAETLRGVALTRETATGTPLTSDMLASVAVVKPGDPVRIEASAGGVKIVVNGEAKAAGRIGDRISVKNIQSGTLLQAYVVDKGLVKVSL